jgi:hypothetical protein
MPLAKPKRISFMCWSGIGHWWAGLEVLGIENIRGSSTHIRGCINCGLMKRIAGEYGNNEELPLLSADCDALFAHREMAFNELAQKKADMLARLNSGQ